MEERMAEHKREVKNFNNSKQDRKPVIYIAPYKCDINKKVLQRECMRRNRFHKTRRIWLQNADGSPSSTLISGTNRRSNQMTFRRRRVLDPVQTSDIMSEMRSDP